MIGAKFAQLAKQLRSLEGAALWLSGGKDSRLLLETLLAAEIPFSILRFDDGWSREQKREFDKLTLDHKLRVYSYPPSTSQMVGDADGELTLISEYAIGAKGERSAIYRDVVEGDRCSFDVPINSWTRRSAPVIFDTHIVGTKRGETHWAIAGAPLAADGMWTFGDIEFHAPLFDWTDEEVIQALRLLFDVHWQKPSDAMDTGNLAVCSSCLHGVNDVHCPKTGTARKALDWSPTEMLEAWRKRVGIEV